MSLWKRGATAVLTTSLLVTGSSLASAPAVGAVGPQTMVKHLQRSHRPAKMKLHQIASGHFNSLKGRWVETAHGTNAYGGRGLIRGGSTKMSVTSKQIAVGSLIIRGRTLSDGQSLRRAKLVFTRQNRYLSAGLKNQEVAINYVVSFYPRGVPLHLFTSTNGVKISTKRNRIVVWTSNNSYTEVFSQR